MIHFKKQAKGFAAASLLLWSPILSTSSHAWTTDECRRVVLTGAEYKFKAKTIDEMIHNIETTNIDDLGDRSIRSPWEMGMVPNLTARKIGYQYQLQLLSGEKNATHAEALAITMDILNGGTSYLSSYPSSNPKLKALADETKSDRPELKDANFFSEWGVCAYYQPRESLKCYQALSNILQVMAPVDGITARDRIYEVMSEKSYQEPLALLALEYIDLIEKGLPIMGRKLDEDLSRVLPTDDMKWSVLAVLSARGANFYKLFEFASKKDFRTVAALGVISSAALYFDSLEPSELFSFPKGVQVGCDSGKSYHFWMSAYLAHRFGSPWAAYLSDVGYQMKSKTEFRNPDRAFTEAWNSPSNQRIRLDLAYSAAGAEYGISQDDSFRFNVDRVVDELERSSDRLAPLGKEEVQSLWNAYGIGAFVRWNRIFHPDKAMD